MRKIQNNRFRGEGAGGGVGTGEAFRFNKNSCDHFYLRPRGARVKDCLV